MPPITKSTPILNATKQTNSAKVGLNNNNRPVKTEAPNLTNGSLTSTPDLIPTSSRMKPEATGATTRGSGTSSTSVSATPIPTGEGPRSQTENLLDLTQGSKYDAVQFNGQRIYGSPPPEWSGPPPPKGCEVFVGKVPRDCCERELVPIFERVGQIFELRLMMNFTGLNRGFLFVRYTTREAAKRAVRELNNYEIRPNKFLGVTQSVDNQKLWISGIPKNCTAKEIKAEMERLTDGVRDVILYTSQIDKSKTRGYAFVEYESHRAAALARRKLVPGRVVLLGHEIDKVDWAEPENEVDEEIMATVRVLFIRNLMPTTTEEVIRRVFSDLAGSANCVERVKKMKDYAFVHFVNRDSAESAISAAQNLVLDGCKIEVSWSKPVDKQIYNMRKQLTKVLSSPATGAMQPPILPLSPHMGPMAPPFPPIYSRSPRRRGAAGIKGLGAPGSVPLRGLVRKYASVNPDLDSNQNSKLIGSLMSQPVYQNPHTSLMQEYCMDDLHKSWVEASQHIVTEADEANFTRQFYQSGFHGHHPLAMAAMFAAASGVTPGGFFANPLGQAPPGCLAMIPQGSGGMNGSPFTDLDQLNGALLNMSLQNV